MDGWHRDLRRGLGELEAGGMGRALRVAQPAGRLIYLDGRALVNLGSNDYLGLADHPRLKAAAISAIQRGGVGAGASRLVSGHQAIHEKAERSFASFKHAEAALIFPTGYMANLATLTTLAGKTDLVCLDKLNHASLYDAAAASGATVRVYPHLGLAKLQRVLERHASDSARSAARRFIVTDSVFSMDGDVADLPGLCELADRYQAIVIVDEAHATGVLGHSGAGLCEQQGTTGRVDVVVSTASKALGGLGGIVTARQTVIDTLVNRARSFIYTTAVPPAQAAVIVEALQVIADEPWRRQRLQELGTRLRQAIRRLDWIGTSRGTAPVAPGGDMVTPIVPIIVGTPRAAQVLANHLLAQGFFVPAIRPPSVAPGTCRLRLTLRADLTDHDLTRLIDALEHFRPDGGSTSSD